MIIAAKPILRSPPDSDSASIKRMRGIFSAQTK